MYFLSLLYFPLPFRVPDLASTPCGRLLLSVRTEDADKADKKKLESAHKKVKEPDFRLLPKMQEYLLRVLVVMGDELPASHGRLGVAVKVGQNVAVYTPALSVCIHMLCC